MEKEKNNRGYSLLRKSGILSIRKRDLKSYNNIGTKQTWDSFKIRVNYIKRNNFLSKFQL